MDWPKAIERNHGALLRIVGTLFAMLGLSDNATIDRIPRALHSAILRILRPAEAAVRRLIFVAAKDIVLKLRAERSKPVGKIEKKGKGNTRRPLFRLEDARPPMVPGPPRRKFRKSIGIHFWPYDTLIRPAVPAKPAPVKDGKIDGNRLMRRLQAIVGVLEHLNREARRCARWMARRRKIFATRLIYVNPIRPGPPPYVHEKPRHEVEEVLRECHWLAWEVRGYDTS
jgi:hypothetical protein